MSRGTYIGPRPDLKGKTAQLKDFADGRCLAQFDDATSGMGNGWWDFDEAHFDIAEGEEP